VIPGNDDALRAIDLYCDLMADAILDGLQAEVNRSGKDAGTALEVKVDLPKPVKEEEEETLTPGEAAKKAVEDAANEERDADAKKAASA
jgi:small subunit ribosomal protein S2